MRAGILQHLARMGDPRRAVLFSDDGVLVTGEQVHITGDLKRMGDGVVVGKDDRPRPAYLRALHFVVEALFGQTARAIHLGLLVVNVATIGVLFLLVRRLLGDLAAVAASVATSPESAAARAATSSFAVPTSSSAVAALSSLCAAASSLAAPDKSFDANAAALDTAAASSGFQAPAPGDEPTALGLTPPGVSGWRIPPGADSDATSDAGSPPSRRSSEGSGVPDFAARETVNGVEGTEDGDEDGSS